MNECDNSYATLFYSVFASFCPVLRSFTYKYFGDPLKLTHDERDMFFLRKDYKLHQGIGKKRHMV